MHTHFGEYFIYIYNILYIYVYYLHILFLTLNHWSILTNQTLYSLATSSISVDTVDKLYGDTLIEFCNVENVYL